MKNKVKKTQAFHFQSWDSILFLTFPMGISFFVLYLCHQIEVSAALWGFFIAFVLTFCLARPFFRELEKLLHYLKSEATSEEKVRPPLFCHSRREIIRIFESFRQVKLSWLVKNKVLEAQTLSDSAILENLPNALMMINKQGVIVQTNIMARQLFGHNIVSKKCDEIFPNSPFLNCLKEVICHKKDKTSIEIEYKKKKIIYVKGLIEHLPASTKNGAIVVVVWQDVTAFKILEKSQTAFFANASHELKTPLSVLSGFIETLQGAAHHDLAAQDKFLPIMAAQTNHMSALIQDLLALSRLELNTTTLIKETIQIEALLQSVIQGLQSKAKDNKQHLVLKVQQPLYPLQGHRTGLFRVFQNLIDNAIKYGKSKSTITIFVQNYQTKARKASVQSYIRISVHNKGNPIKSDEIPHLTERFYRVPQKGKPITGTGLGLAIVSEIVTHHDGLLEIESSYLKGTTFCVLLPVCLSTSPSLIINK